MRMVGAELVISSPRTAGEDAARAGPCSLAVMKAFLLLPLLKDVSLFKWSTPEAAVADIFDLGPPPLTTVVAGDDAQLALGAIFESINWFALPITSPVIENSAVLSPADCSLVDDMM